MPKLRRQRIETTEDWSQLELLVVSREQRLYEILRPVVLFGRSPAERARETSVPRRTVYRQADRFEREGMRSLFEEREAVENHKALPDGVRQAIMELKAEDPAFRPHEIATICHVRFGRSVSHHTVKSVLAEGLVPERKRRRYEPCHTSLNTLHSRCWTVVQYFAAQPEVTDAHRDPARQIAWDWLESS